MRRYHPIRIRSPRFCRSVGYPEYEEEVPPFWELIDFDGKDKPMPSRPKLYKRFSNDKTRQLIEDAGFRVVSVTEARPVFQVVVPVMPAGLPVFIRIQYPGYSYKLLNARS
jgi:hypothetical protein